MIRPLLLLLAALALPLAAAPARSPQTKAGLVSAADPRAAAAGVEILRKGGSAADAAIAMMLALNVVEPQSSGIGGGGFMVHHDAKTNKFATFDGREAAPAAADGHWFYQNGQPLQHQEAVPGGRSVGVPGNLRMMALAHARYGRLPWAALFQPAIRLARDGYRITPRLHNSIAQWGDAILSDWGRKHFFAADGTALPVGAILKDPEQAALFAKIAAQGPDYFYHGEPGQKLVAAVNHAPRNASKMTMADLTAYQAKERAPICGTYRVYRVCGMGPPSAGGITVLMILKQLERFDLAKLGKDNPVAWHLLAESERLAYADRDAYMGDADHVTVPVRGLLDATYLARRSALIAPDRTMPTIAPGAPAGVPVRMAGIASPEHGTTDMAAVDAQGNVVEVTSTIESVFGSGLTVDGILLNNELTDFDIVPERGGMSAANRVEAGKRPRSSMAPTIVYGPDGKVRIAIGAAGGSTIIAQVAKALIGVLDWHMRAQDAIGMGLIYTPGPGGVVEQGTQLEPMLPALAQLGERLRPAPLGLKANAIEQVGGRWAGAADPRSEGVAMAVSGTVTGGKRVTMQPGVHE
ncbi:MAG TPA: gamma-glutamyltransferase [Sphingomonas sp.]|uniref:gamma-glutamyltransferase n=1 Tax=Sphingomonas sp. TaxID=28214 RepID=UPI002BC82154|nr:gamma-glutamyltransferase [Sphingomonas sp.]HMI19760.1 gamma-glutamyltransferase [Sphingomonas sp.]